MVMSSDIKNFDEHRRRIAAEGKRRRREQMHEEGLQAIFEFNKNVWAEGAFADCFINILREVNRVQPNASVVGDLGRFFKLLDRGAKVNLWTLTQAALERIKPPNERYHGNDEGKLRDQALLDVALAGIAFLVENAATDQNARTRRMKRQDKLELAIRAYMDAHDSLLRKRHGRGSGAPSTR